jgi:post-segregation antitoxin (ccd killing protein)
MTAERRPTGPKPRGGATGKRVTLRLSLDEERQYVALAVRRDITISELIRAAMARELARAPGER